MKPAKAEAKAAYSHNLAICGEGRSTKSSSAKGPSRMPGQDYTDIRSVCQSASWLDLDGPDGSGSGSASASAREHAFLIT